MNCPRCKRELLGFNPAPGSPVEMTHNADYTIDIRPFGVAHLFVGDPCGCPIRLVQEHPAHMGGEIRVAGT